MQFRQQPGASCSGRDSRPNPVAALCKARRLHRTLRLSAVVEETPASLMPRKGQDNQRPQGLARSRFMRPRLSKPQLSERQQQEAQLQRQRPRPVVFDDEEPVDADASLSEEGEDAFDQGAGQLEAGAAAKRFQLQLQPVLLPLDDEGGAIADAAVHQEQPAPLRSFNQLSGPTQLLRNMKAGRLLRPTPLQAHAIPVLQAGRDLLLAAPPGSGATHAYLLPLLQRLMRRSRLRTTNRAYPGALLLAPTRELAAQLHTEVCALVAGSHLKACCVTGGAPIAQQKLALRGGTDVLTATPGRLLDHLRHGSVSLLALQALVVDEADLLLGPGFEPHLRHVATHDTMPPPGARQTVVCCSAAAPAARLAAAAADYLAPSFVTLRAGEEEEGPAMRGVQHHVVEMAPQQRVRALQRLVVEATGGDGSGMSSTGGAEGSPGLVLVFANTHEVADDVGRQLSRAGVAAGVLHSGRSQDERDEALLCFRFGVTPVLVACGIAGRGLELQDVTHVVNYDAPRDAAEYARHAACAAPSSGAGSGGAGAVAAHAVGPGGQRSGAVTTLVTQRDSGAARWLMRCLRAAHQPVPEWLEGMAAETAAAAAAQAVPGAEGSTTEQQQGGMDAVGAARQLPSRESIYYAMRRSSRAKPHNMGQYLGSARRRSRSVRARAWCVSHRPCHL